VKLHAAHGKEILYKAALVSVAFFHGALNSTGQAIRHAVAQGRNVADKG